MIFFLVNGDQKIGSGHFGRCLNIARGLKGQKVTFLSWSLDEKFQDILHGAEIGFQYIAYADLQNLSHALEHQGPGLLVVDSDDPQVFDPAFQKSIRATGMKLMMITVSDRYHFYADIVLNQSILSLEHHYKTEAYTRLLLGPKYFIFDEKYRDLQLCAPKPAGRNVFIGFGAADPMNYAYKILQSIHARGSFQDWNFHVVMGSLNSEDRVHQVKQLAENSDLSVEVYFNARELWKIYETCDLAICSPGRMFWELALYGVQSIVLSSAPREIPSADFLGRHQYAKLALQCDQKWDSGPVTQALLAGEVAPKLVELQDQINPNGLQYLCDEMLELTIR